jgi:hypothetical protein
MYMFNTLPSSHSSLEYIIELHNRVPVPQAVFSVLAAMSGDLEGGIPCWGWLPASLEASILHSNSLPRGAPSVHGRRY